MKSLLIIANIIFVTNCQNFVDLNVELVNRDKLMISANLEKIKDPDSCFIYRSYENLNSLGAIDLSTYPISKVHLKVEGSKVEYIDSLFADNCRYFYYMKIKTHNGRLIPSTTDSVLIENTEVVSYENMKTSIFIDKKNYFLEIRCDNIPIKRFPVNLGRKPWNRKLHFDKMSTPEGKYYLTHFNYKSSFHKSMGVSYPNNVDRKRYNEAMVNKKIPKINDQYAKIGGSITIHGGGIGDNWTWGCIAMRNRDIDEILSLKSIKVGIPILIVGNEVTRKDLY